MAKLVANSEDPDQIKWLYLQNFWMEVVHPCPDVRYWSEILCCTIPTYMSDLEVKVMDLETNYDAKGFG